MLVDFLGSTAFDWTVRKMAIDVIYTFAAILKENIAPYKGELVETLGETRTDKIKPVREASLEALQAVKELPNVIEQRTVRRNAGLRGSPQSRKDNSASRAAKKDLSPKAVAPKRSSLTSGLA